MADLDTTSKRRSSVQIAAPYNNAPPLPDGTLNQGDRQHIALSYSGIAASGAAPSSNRSTRMIFIPDFSHGLSPITGG